MKITYDMRNFLIYYVIILAPIGILIGLHTTNLLDKTLFVLLILYYALVYRTYTDGKRLVNKKLISEKDIWKMLIPGYRLKYFKELYLR